MGLFTKKENKNYIVFDHYSGEAIAACVTREVKQILQIQPKAQFVECDFNELLEYNDYSRLPDDIDSRRRLTAKEVK